jgi:ABC-2 type transport system ATP-binding protein
LRGQGKTIVFASHQLDSIERVSDKLLFLKDQQILTVENMGQDVEMQYGEMYLT